MLLERIAVVRTDFPEKFALPRQSGIVPGLTGRIVFEPEYRSPEALRGLDGFSHIWVIWGFSEGFASTGQGDAKWSPTVRPPRLGGNVRMGVFATRSPNRPNPVALSVVKLEKIDWDGPDGPCLEISGIDMVDGSPVYDIKPYLPHIDAIPDARGGFAEEVRGDRLTVLFPEELDGILPEEKKEPLIRLLAGDPRPSYQDDPDRDYHFSYAGYTIRFRVRDGELTVLGIEPMT